MTPVLILSDGYLANGSEPWQIPDTEDLPEFDVRLATERNGIDADSNGIFHYLRDPETLARPWAVPGTPGLEHRVGGIEGQHHREHLLRPRQPRPDDPPTGGEDRRDRRHGRPARGRRPGRRRRGSGTRVGLDLRTDRCRREILRAQGFPVAQAHLRHLNPFPSNTGEVLTAYRHVIVPEMNLGQLSMLLRATFLVDIQSHVRARAAVQRRRSRGRHPEAVTE